MILTVEFLLRHFTNGNKIDVLFSESKTAILLGHSDNFKLSREGRGGDI